MKSASRLVRSRRPVKALKWAEKLLYDSKFRKRCNQFGKDAHDLLNSTLGNDRRRI
jgi:hypothetical protein